MSLIIYMPKAGESRRRLQELIGRLVWQEPIEIFYHFSQLDFRLRHPSGNEDIALLCASTLQDLHDFIRLRSLLSNLRLILIIPNRESETVAKGHLLRPRFMGYLDSDFSDLVLVLKKMEKISTPYPHSIQSEIIVPRGGGKPHPPSFLLGEGMRK